MQETNQVRSDTLESKKSHWQEIIDDWKRSGERQQLYCTRLGINFHTFNYWRTKFTDKNKGKKGFAKFIQAATSIQAEEKPIIIQLLSGNKIIIPQSLGNDKLKNILVILGVINA